VFGLEVGLACPLWSTATGIMLVPQPMGRAAFGKMRACTDVRMRVWQQVK